MKLIRSSTTVAVFDIDGDLVMPIQIDSHYQETRSPFGTKLSPTGITTIDLINPEHCRPLVHVRILQIGISTKVLASVRKHRNEKSHPKSDSGWTWWPGPVTPWRRPDPASSLILG
jgi:hypothetical protein